jgi:hypothetical protein
MCRGFLEIAESVQYHAFIMVFFLNCNILETFQEEMHASDKKY